jgi:hypothetical protein
VRERRRCCSRYPRKSPTIDAKELFGDISWSGDGAAVQRAAGERRSLVESRDHAVV